MQKGRAEPAPRPMQRVQVIQVSRQAGQSWGCPCPCSHTWVAVSPRLPVLIKKTCSSCTSPAWFSSSLSFLLYFCYCFLHLFCQSRAECFSVMVSCSGRWENKVGFRLASEQLPKGLGTESSSAGFRGAMLRFACNQNNPFHILPYGERRQSRCFSFLIIVLEVLQ